MEVTMRAGAHAMIVSSWVVLCSGAWCVLLSFPAVAETSSAPNVLLITVDTLRADHLGCYGYPKNTSPSIDALAREGTLFETVMAPRGATYPSLVSLHTSLYPSQHGIRTNRGGDTVEEITMLAEILSEQGYATGAFLTNAQWGNWQGFDTAAFCNDWDLNLRGLKWLKTLKKDTPFFLWMHYYRPHVPYQPPVFYRKMFADMNYAGPATGSMEEMYRIQAKGEPLTPVDIDHIHGLYDAEIRADDDLIGELLGYLSDKGILDSTLVLFTADHGETIWTRNQYLFHGASIHDAALRIPLIIRYPESVPEGLRVSGVAELIDVAPTILDLLHFPVPKYYEGMSLVPAMEGESLESKVAFSELEDKVLSLRTHKYRYVYNPTNYAPITVSARRLEAMNITIPLRYKIEAIELFDVEADPYETHNIAAENPALVKRFQALIEAWQKRSGWELNGAALQQAIDPILAEQLEALGYIADQTPEP